MKNKIPKFPNFRPFDINDTLWYESYYLKEGLNPYADISPGDILVWLDANNDLSVSKLNGTIILRYTNIFNNNQINIIPLANSLHDLVIEKIMLFLIENDLPPELHEIPSIICNKLDRNQWLIKTDRDGYEYILDTSQQSTLQGSNYYRLRNNVNLFERVHSDDVIDIKYYNEFNDEAKEVFLHHINTMPFNNRNEASQENTMEPIAIRKNLEYASFFHKKALIIKINRKVVSISMISFLDKNTAAINHLKVDYSVKNIFRYTVYQLSKILNENGIKEINFEQDLGIEGLREFKKYLRPSRFLKKNSICARHL